MTCFAEHFQSVPCVMEVCLPKCFVCCESADQDFDAALGHVRPPFGGDQCSRCANQESSRRHP